MNKADIMEHVMSETGTLCGLKKSTVEHILKEYEIALLNGLELDGEVPLLNFGKLVLEIKKVRTLKSKFIKEGSKELPERAVAPKDPAVAVEYTAGQGDIAHHLEYCAVIIIERVVELREHAVGYRHERRR